MTIRLSPAKTYLGLALLILGPLLLPGYILTLDMSFTPELRAPSSVNSSYPLYMLLHWLDLVLPADWIQKLLLLTIFWLAGYGMYRLVGASQTDHRSLTLPTVASYAAGLFYMVNPFTYDRLMTGQFAVVFGYALLPWCLLAIWRLTTQPSRHRALVAAAWTAGLGIVSIHSLGPLLIIAGLLLALRLWQLRRQPAGQWRLLKLVGMAGGVWLVVSSYWLLPALLGKSQTARTVSGFGEGDRMAFATLGANGLERLGNVLGLQGFWAENRGMFRLPQDMLPAGLWLALMVTMLVLVIVGGLALWRQQRGLAAVLGSCIVLGAVLGAGLGAGWLAQYLPFYAGYREPQKFAMLIALGYGVLLAYGIGACWQRLSAWRRPALTHRLLAVSALSLPILLTPTMAWGTAGQLQASDYPAGWYTANQQLNRDPDTRDFKTLFLPWHLYIEADFAGRTIATPAGNFFDKPVIVSDDPELEGVSLSKSTATTRRVGQLLDSGPASDRQLGEGLAKLNVKYILLAETSDYRRYGYLARQVNLQLVGDYQGMKLYRNLAFPVQ